MLVSPLTITECQPCVQCSLVVLGAMDSCSDRNLVKILLFCPFPVYPLLSTFEEAIKKCWSHRGPGVL